MFLTVTSCDIRYIYIFLQVLSYWLDLELFLNPRAIAFTVESWLYEYF